jgi:hypothetical protein
MMNNKNQVLFLNEALAEEKEQPIMCQHHFQHLVGSALDSQCQYLQALGGFQITVAIKDENEHVNFLPSTICCAGEMTVWISLSTESSSTGVVIG